MRNNEGHTGKKKNYFYGEIATVKRPQSIQFFPVYINISFSKHFLSFITTSQM